MSDFTDGVTAPEQATQEAETEDYLAQMVGEGKKYTSVEEAARALAKKAVNADSFIETLKTEKQQLESQYNELQTRNKSIDEIVQALRKPEPQAQPPQEGGMSVDEIIAELEKRNEQKSAAQKRAEAIQATWQALSSEEVFGDTEKAKVAVATYINGDANRKALVDQMALADPKGLITLLKQNKEVVTFSENSSGKVVEPGASPTGKLTWDIAKRIRKEDPKLYHSKAFQNRMHTEL